MSAIHSTSFYFGAHLSLALAVLGMSLFDPGMLWALPIPGVSALVYWLLLKKEAA